MISGGEGESSDDEEVEAPSQWSRITNPPKLLGVDPTSQLEVVISPNHQIYIVFALVFFVSANVVYIRKMKR